MANRARQMVYRFHELSHLDRLNLALSLGLLGEEDRAKTEPEMWLTAFERAADRGRMEEFERAIEAAHG